MNDGCADAISCSGRVKTSSSRLNCDPRRRPGTDLRSLYSNRFASWNPVDQWLRQVERLRQSFDARPTDAVSDIISLDACQKAILRSEPALRPDRGRVGPYLGLGEVHQSHVAVATLGPLRDDTVNADGGWRSARLKPTSCDWWRSTDCVRSPPVSRVATGLDIVGRTQSDEKQVG